MAPADAPRRPLLAALLLVAILGSADVGLFIATDPGTALKNGGRATGSLAGLATWLLLVAVAGGRVSGRQKPWLAPVSIALGALAAVEGVGLAVVHQLAGVGGPRTVAGGLLGVAALVLVVGARPRPASLAGGSQEV